MRVWSLAGQRSDRGGSGVNFAVMRSTAMACTVIWSILGKKAFGRSVSAVLYFAISASQNRCLASRFSTMRTLPNRQTLR